MNDLDKFKPCPWCATVDTLGISPDADGYRVECGYCDISGQPRSTVTAAVCAWNERTAPLAPRTLSARVAGLEAALPLICAALEELEAARQGGAQ